MIIVSQDKKVILNFNNIVSLEIGEHIANMDGEREATIEAIDECSNVNRLAYYETEERAESKVTDLNPIGLARTNQLLSRQCHKLQEENEKKDKMIDSIKEYAQQEIDFATEDIEDYIDDDREGNKDIIGELKEWREHWKDIIRIMNNEKTYIDFEYKVTDTNVGERKSENGN